MSNTSRGVPARATLAAVAALAALLAAGASAGAQEGGSGLRSKFALVAKIGDQPGGLFSLQGGVSFGPSGALYGTAQERGPLGWGGVYEIVLPTATSKLSFTTIFAFPGYGMPVDDVAFDSSGAIFGEMQVGPSHANCGLGYCGAIYKLTPPTPPATAWTGEDIHNFSAAGPNRPLGGLAIDATGALYGATNFGGAGGVGGPNAGAIFRLSPPTSSGAPWKATVLHTFGQAFGDGSYPSGGPIFGKDGALYGLLYLGPGVNQGAVYRLAPPVPPSQRWTEAILYAFPGGTDAAQPADRLAFDTQGALYGVSQQGGGTGCGGTGCGTIFRLSPPSASDAPAPWKETVLYAFQGGADGANPVGPLVLDASGALYGATTSGGVDGCFGFGCGTVFALTPPKPPIVQWSHAVLHAFPNGDAGDGPIDGLTADKRGRLFGATFAGGANDAGVVFELH